jgi:hypothetical protein
MGSELKSVRKKISNAPSPSLAASLATRVQLRSRREGAFDFATGAFSNERMILGISAPLDARRKRRGY